MLKKIQHRVVQTSILISAVVTIGILTLIVGFTLYRGFYSETVSDWNVLTRGEEAVEYRGKKYFIIAHPQLKLDDLTFEALDKIARGRTKNWGLITTQDMSVKKYILKEDEESFSDRALKVLTPEDLVFSVKQNRGAVGFLPVESNYHYTGVTLIPVRSIALAVNDEVLKTENNRRLRHLDDENVERLLSGKIDNWSEAGGRDLPVTIVIPPGNTYLYHSVNTLYNNVLDTAVNAVRVSSLREFQRVFAITPGAVAPMDIREAQESGKKLLPIRRKESGLNLSWSFITEPPKKSGRVGGISTIILNTLIMIILTLIFAVPVGIASAVYLTMYAPKGRITSLIKRGVETLAGIPSVIFGLFGFIVFVEKLHMGVGLISGTLTVSLMILPTIIRTAEEAVKAVPPTFYAGSLALGASKWQAIKTVVIPAASPGILTGVILGMGRAVGETAALLFTMGFDYRLVNSLQSSARVLSVHLYQLVKEGISFERAFASATILIIVILIMNLTTSLIIGRFNGTSSGK